MYQCNRCKGEFDEPEALAVGTDTTEFWGNVQTHTIYEDFCPFCHSQDFVEVDEEEEYEIH